MSKNAATYELRGSAMAVLALLVGAFAGATLTISPVALMVVAEGLRQDYAFAFVTFLAALAVWSLGLLTLAAPAWRVLHRRGHRSRSAALVLGAAMASGVGVMINLLLGLLTGQGYSSGDGGGDVWINGRLTLYGWGQAFLGAILLGAVGALVGWVVCRVAYRLER